MCGLVCVGVGEDVCRCESVSVSVWVGVTGGRGRCRCDISSYWKRDSGHERENGSMKAL